MITPTYKIVTDFESTVTTLETLQKDLRVGCQIFENDKPIGMVTSRLQIMFGAMFVMDAVKRCDASDIISGDFLLLIDNIMSFDIWNFDHQKMEETSLAVEAIYSSYLNEKLRTGSKRSLINCALADAIGFLCHSASKVLYKSKNNFLLYSVLIKIEEAERLLNIDERLSGRVRGKIVIDFFKSDEYLFLIGGN